MKKATDISKKVRDAVWKRDGECCIMCGDPHAMPNAHYIRRSRGGLGIPENIVTLCNRCHYKYDFENDQTIKRAIEDYLRGQYPDWDPEDLVYDKWRDWPV